MLQDFPVYPVLPVVDLERAKKFYTQTLGLSVAKETEGGITFKAGDSTKLYVYKRGLTKADHTVSTFMVLDIEKTVDDLIAKGVVFEQYDYPELKTDKKGIVVSKIEGEKAAWFKDPDGNILALGEEL
jgi:catechol 2,3-dioxygenase-like lactoylglutathione lyase family enzyme